MTWVPLLLTDPSPSLRLLVLRELLSRADDDPEVEELEKLRQEDPIVTRLLTLQQGDGSWSDLGIGGSLSTDKIQATSYALTTLGYIGFRSDNQTVAQGADYLFRKQRRDGSWPLPGKLILDGEKSTNYTMVPLQTAMPLRGLAACGYSTDARCESAYDWLRDQKLDDGAWPTGRVGRVYRGVGGYRRLAHSAWGCRTNTTMALICLSLHPKRRLSQDAHRAMDLLLGRETRDKQNVGFEVARIIGAEEPRGYLTYFAKFDLALLLDLCWRIGANKSDERVADLAAYVTKIRGEHGLWEYAPHIEASGWVTFDILRSLTRIDDSTDWLSMEPRTPFRAYPLRQKRF